MHTQLRGFQNGSLPTYFAGNAIMSAELENLSDRSLEDIGLVVIKRDFGTLKPFWIP